MDTILIYHITLHGRLPGYCDGYLMKMPSSEAFRLEILEALGNLKTNDNIFNIMQGCYRK